MAVTQKSKIQIRRGRRENLPQLAGGELGWAVDTQQLFIGNGTFEEGAASEGNTEIITVSNPTIVGLLTPTFISVELLDNTLIETIIASINIVAFPVGMLYYSIKRAGNYRAGMYQYAYNAGTASVDVFDATTGDSLGITLTATVSGDFMLLKYTSTDTGSAATFKYRRIDLQ
jgi:hypothetical protein